MRFLLVFCVFLALSCYPVPPYTGSQQQWSQGGSSYQGGSHAQNPNPNAQNPNSQRPNPTQATNPYPENSKAVTTRHNSLPYDLVPDLLSTLTCRQNVSLISVGGPYTISLGAYFEGLKLSDKFKNDHSIQDRDFRENPQRIRQLIERSPLKGAYAELSLRRASNVMHSPIEFKGKNPIRQLFSLLWDAHVIEQLSQKGKALETRPVNRNQYNSFPFKTKFTNMDGAEFLGALPALSQGSGELLLALLYTFNSNPPQPIFVTGTQVYGKTYKLEFNNAQAGDYLTDVFEEDLTNNKRGGEWTCPERLRFIVHREKNPQGRAHSFNNKAFITLEHRGRIAPELKPEGYCDTTRAPFSSNAREMVYLKKEFGSRPSNWPFKLGISMVYSNNEGISTTTKGTIESNQFRRTNQACIVPTHECYSTGGDFFRVEFDMNRINNCEKMRGGTNFTNPDDPIYKVCPAFLSMCYRNPE